MVFCGWCRATHGTIRTVHTTYAAALKTTTIQKLDAENHMLQLNIWCSWWWAYAPETCRAKNTSIKLPCCIKLAFHIIPFFTVVVPTDNKPAHYKHSTSVSSSLSFPHPSSHSGPEETPNSFDGAIGGFTSLVLSPPLFDRPVVCTAKGLLLLFAFWSLPPFSKMDLRQFSSCVCR